jgi:hypothetical protein
VAKRNQKIAELPQGETWQQFKLFEPDDKLREELETFRSQLRDMFPESLYQEKLFQGMRGRVFVPDDDCAAEVSIMYAPDGEQTGAVPPAKHTSSVETDFRSAALEVLRLDKHKGKLYTALKKAVSDGDENAFNSQECFISDRKQKEAS